MRPAFSIEVRDEKSVVVVAGWGGGGEKKKNQFRNE
jgi:hypothetical protein